MNNYFKLLSIPDYQLRSGCTSESYYTVSQKGFHPTTNYDFNNNCRIPVIFGTNITE